jgi:DNA-binding NtrC family response regulator
MTAMTEYHWPGNVRELEHFIERSVILSRAPELQPPLAELSPPMLSASAVAGSANHAVTLSDAEREHFRRTLEEPRGGLAGPAGAAASRGLERTTGERVTVADLPAEVAAASAGGPPPSGAPGSLPMTGLDAVERDAIVTAILTYHGNLTQVARALRIAKSTLYLKITKYGLDHVLQTVRPSDR